MGRASLAAVVMVAVSTLGCLGPRDPGPLEEEFGQVLFWEVTSTSLGDEGCTDDPAFQDTLSLPPLEENTYFMYRVSDDGKTAVAQDCAELDADSCVAVDDITFDIDGHEHVWSPEPESITRSPVCEVFGRQVWRFDDQGTDGTLDILIDFPFEGTDNGCAELDADMAAQSTNGLGLASCEISLSAELAFSFAD